MVNKRGVVLHWGVVIFIIGFIIFIGATASTTPSQPKGQWQVDFLKDNYLPAKQALLENAITARMIGFQVIEEVALSGGFIASDIVSSSCGKVQDFFLWNSPAERCFPDVSGTILKKATSIAEEQGFSYSGLTFEKGAFSGEGLRKDIVSPHGIYSYIDGFSVLLPYDLGEYDLLFQQAEDLLISCQEEVELQKCLVGKKQDYWHFFSCDSEKYVEDARKVPFCVVSPNLYPLPAGGQAKKLVIYQFALDFTPTTPVSGDSTPSS
ncbi:MAG TPA: hypothetical protein VJI15_04245 [Candidatus Nanoarchaeia archaeon]|nr:hypothetical protein [Candidatus Nanoarchaeia archaeon]